MVVFLRCYAESVSARSLRNLLTALLIAAVSASAQIPSTLNITLFEAPITIPNQRTGVAVTHLFAADFNQDKMDDVAVAWSSGGFSVYLGTADGQMKLDKHFDSGSFNVTGLVVADYSGDKLFDIVISKEEPNARPRNGQICYYANSAAGFVAQPRCQDSPYRAIEADELNADGFADLLGHNPENGTLGVFIGSGFGNFRLLQEFARVSPGGPYHRQAMVDLNFDRRAELIFLDDRTIRIYHNDASLGLLVPGWTFSVPGRDGALYIADFNRDGRRDLLARSTNGNEMQEAFFLGTSNNAPYFSYARGADRDPAIFPVGLVPIDFDQDGLPDLTGPAADGFFVLRNLGGLNFRRVAQDKLVTGASNANGSLLVGGDFNGDARADFVTVNRTTGALEHYRGRPVAKAGVTASVRRTELVYGEKVIISARATGEAFPPFGVPRAGKVEFRNGTTVLARVDLKPAFEPSGPPAEGTVLDLGSAETEVSLPAGALEITASLEPGLLWEGKVSEPVKALVQPAPVTLTLISVPGRLNRGQALRFDVEARAVPATVVAGKITAGFAGAGVTVDLRNGRAAISIPTDEAEEGAHPVIVQFEGVNYTPASREAFVTVQPSVVTGPGAVSSASLQSRVAPDSLAIVRINQLFTTAASVPNPPWPTTLNNTTVRLVDSAGVESMAPISFVGPGQVNIHIPAGVTPGKVAVSVRTSAQLFDFEIEVSNVAPALFTANNTGRGAPAGTGVRINAEGQETPIELARCTFGCTISPINLGEETDTVILTLSGTGIRRAAELKATIGEEALEVLGMEPHPTIPGRDLVRIKLPRTLVGKGAVELILSADGAPSNAVSLIIE